MDYSEIPALIEAHLERIRRCKDLKQGFNQYGDKIRDLKVNSNINDWFVQMYGPEAVEILDLLITKSEALVTKLSEQDEKLREISKNFS